MARFHSITRCRICGSADLISVLNLGEQALTGVFPRRAGEVLTRGPLELVGSNDGTLLAGYATPGLRRIGMDPTGAKFRAHYPAGAELVADFFSAAGFRRVVPQGGARIVTSIAMFYDLEEPSAFVRDIGCASRHGLPAAW
jgi:hypothetical protein